MNSNGYDAAATRGDAFSYAPSNTGHVRPDGTVQNQDNQTSPQLAPPYASFNSSYMAVDGNFQNAAFQDNAQVDDIDYRLRAAMNAYLQDFTRFSSAMDTGYYSDQSSVAGPSIPDTVFTTQESSYMPPLNKVQFSQWNNGMPQYSGVGSNNPDGTPFFDLIGPISRQPVREPDVQASGGLKRSQAESSPSGSTKSDSQPLPKQQKRGQEVPSHVATAQQNALLEWWLKICVLHRLDPLDDDVRINALSTLLDMSPAKIGRWYSHLELATGSKQAERSSEMLVDISDVHREEAFKWWREVCVLQGCDPIEDDGKVEALSALLKLSTAKIGRWYGLYAHQPVLQQSNMSNISPATDVNKRDEQKQKMVQEYVARAKASPCRKDVPIPSKGGRLKCTWGCPFSHRRRCEWERHEELKQPQNFWICATCFDETGTSAFMTARKDKILDHGRSVHQLGQQGRFDLRMNSKVEYEAGFERVCTFQFALNDRPCGHCFEGSDGTWKARNDHWIRHFDNDMPGDNDGLPDHLNASDENDDSWGNSGGTTNGSASRSRLSWSQNSSNNGGMSGYSANGSAPSYTGPSYMMRRHAAELKGPSLLIDVQRQCLLAPSKAEKYLALSYTWLGDKMPTAYSAPRESLIADSASLTSLGYICLPFRKAIELTRDMGYRYVWIDALCASQVTEPEKNMVFSSAMMIIVMAACPKADDQIWHFTCSYDKLSTVQSWMKSKITLHHIQTLGHGAYGIVDEVRLLPVQKNFARKKLFDSVTESAPRNWQAQEIEVMQKLNRLEHPHIARFVAAYYDSRALNILMTPVAEGNLGQLLAAPEKWASKRSHLQRWFMSIACAVRSMHNYRCRHKDIKPANILISGDEVILSDFGTSFDFETSSSLSEGSAFMTPKYCAPEVAKHDARGRSADIFSLGCVFTEMITVELGNTLGDMNDFLGVYDERNSRRISYHQQIYGLRCWLQQLKQLTSGDHQREILKLCYDMLSSNPERRPKASDVVRRLCTEKDCHELTDAHPCHCCHERRVWIDAKGFEQLVWRTLQSAGLRKVEGGQGVSLVMLPFKQGSMWRPVNGHSPQYTWTGSLSFWTEAVGYSHSYIASTSAWTLTQMICFQRRRHTRIFRSGLVHFYGRAQVMSKNVEVCSVRLATAIRRSISSSTGRLRSVSLVQRTSVCRQRPSSARLQKAVRKISQALRFTMSCKHGSNAVSLHVISSQLSFAQQRIDYKETTSNEEQARLQGVLKAQLMNTAVNEGAGAAASDQPSRDATPTSGTSDSCQCASKAQRTCDAQGETVLEHSTGDLAASNTDPVMKFCDTQMTEPDAPGIYGPNEKDDEDQLEVGDLGTVSLKALRDALGKQKNCKCHMKILSEADDSAHISPESREYFQASAGVLQSNVEAYGSPSLNGLPDMSAGASRDVSQGSLPIEPSPLPALVDDGEPWSSLNRSLSMTFGTCAGVQYTVELDVSVERWEDYGNFDKAEGRTECRQSALDYPFFSS